MVHGLKIDSLRQFPGLVRDSILPVGWFRKARSIQSCFSLIICGILVRLKPGGITTSSPCRTEIFRMTLLALGTFPDGKRREIFHDGACCAAELEVGGESIEEATGGHGPPVSTQLL